MSYAQPLVTNRENATVIEELSLISGISPEQYVSDSVLSLFICIKAIKTNKEMHKSSPTRILFEQEDGSYNAYDLLEMILQASEQMTPVVIDDPALRDALQDDEQIALPLHAETETDLDQICDFLSLPQTDVVAGAINLKSQMQPSFAHSLGVLIETHNPDEYLEMPASFFD
jgi:hypothetical protein